MNELNCNGLFLTNQALEAVFHNRMVRHGYCISGYFDNVHEQSLSSVYPWLAQLNTVLHLVNTQ